MKVKNYAIVVMVCWIMLVFSGCFGMQIVSNQEAGTGPSFIAGLAADYIKLKYSDRLDFYTDLADKVLVASSNKEIETAFNSWIDSLSNDIKDPELKILADRILKSFDVKIDGINYDWGAREKARMIVEEFKRVLNAGV